MNKDERAFYTINRFGLGPKQGELASVRNDPRGWLFDQLNNMGSYRSPAVLNLDYRKIVSEFQQAKKNKEPKQKKNARKAIKKFGFQYIQQELMACQHTTHPLIERLVMFWSNHFTVSSRKQNVIPLIPDYVTHAIRGNLKGRFSDMLIAVEQHPAMLLYLDNVGSVSPNSVVGKRRKRGLNENLAREILELHTMGAVGGYQQSDVESLARIITGWGINKPTATEYATFNFRNRAHDAGTKVLLGTEYHNDGVEEGIRALKNIAQHPSTAQFIATKLVRYFVADNPPPRLIKNVAHTFLETDGHLNEVMIELIKNDETWRYSKAKFKNPYEFFISTLRALPVEISAKLVKKSFQALNFIPYTAPSPGGWPDDTSHWATADALKKRINWSYRFTRASQKEFGDAHQMIDTIVGKALSSETQKMVRGAGSKKEALALLFISPEFQRK